MLFKVYYTSLKRAEILLAEICLCNSAIVLECSYCSNQNHRIRLKVVHSALDIEELLSSEICAKSCLCYYIICKL